MLANRIADRIGNAQTLIDAIAAYPAIQQALAAYGFDAERLAQGQALCASALARYEQQQRERGNLSAAQEAQDRALVQARNEYVRLTSVARIAFKGNHSALQKLGLLGGCKTWNAGWLLQARQFYATALADGAMQAVLAEYGVTVAKLEAGQQQLAALKASQLAKIGQQSGAKHATAERDQVLYDLDMWVHEVRDIARWALRQQPQYLHLLRIAAPPAPRRRSTEGAMAAQPAD